MGKLDSKDKFEEYLWDVSEGRLSTFKSLRGKGNLTENPYFESHQIDGAGQSSTRKYLRNRVFKRIGGAVFSLGGTVAKSVTAVNTGSIAMHAQAIGLSTVHNQKLSAIARKHTKRGKSDDKGTVVTWIDLVHRMKQVKTASRTVALAGAAIPIPAVGSGAAVARAIARRKTKMTYGSLCNRVAMELHWRAYQEVALSSMFGSSKGAVGPASEILYEIFAKRGATRIFGKYDVERLIAEDVGWHAVSEKLMLA